MKKVFFAKTLLLIFHLSFLAAVNLPAQTKSSLKNILQQDYNLVPIHSKDTQYYAMESTLLKYNINGSRSGSDTYRLYLRSVPANKNGFKGDEYTCIKFTVQINTSAEVAIPSLANWTYFFSLSKNGKDDNGQLFGIDHNKFEHLIDENGKSLPLENTFHVYNAFIDFHSMSVFAEKTDTGKGVQNLKHIGDKIIHSASFSQPSENLGSQVLEGTYFKNGEITLAFKGIGMAGNKECAIVGYDSGESSFNMITKAMATLEVKTKGSSHYFGDIYKDLHGGWIQKATLHEFVISETEVAGQPDKIHSVIERSISINNLPKLNLDALK